MGYKYTSYAELKQNEKENEDYTIFYRQTDSQISIIAPHGGGIEPSTGDIADALAEGDYTFYAFKGLKKTGNRILHISSNTFDEALGLKASQNAQITISIHGSKYKTERVHIGGRDQDLKQKIRHALKAAGFEAEISQVTGLLGVRPENICNRCRTGKGVQLEISKGLREKMFDNLDHRLLRMRTTVFYRFVNTLKEVLRMEKKTIPDNQGQIEAS